MTVVWIVLAVGFAFALAAGIGAYYVPFCVLEPSPRPRPPLLRAPGPVVDVKPVPKPARRRAR